MSIIALAAAAALGQASQASIVEISDFAGEIRIEQGTSFGARVERQDSEAPVSIDENRNGLIIDGGRDLRRWGCYGGWRESQVGRNRSSARAFDELPLLIITTPDPVALTIEDSIIQGRADDLASLDLGARSCGDFAAGDILGDANIRISGSMDVDTGDVGGEASVSVSGSGDITLGDVTGNLDARFSGSGDFEAGSSAEASIRASGSSDVTLGDVTGDLSLQISGSGDVEAGRVGDLSASTSGSGDVSVESSGGLSVRSSGSSEYTLESLNGPLSVEINGSGDVEIGSGRADIFTVSTGGSGGVSFGGVVGEADVRIRGSGDVRVNRVEGSQRVRATGSGDFRVSN